MDKSCKNIIEAGITPKEFIELYEEVIINKTEVTMDNYLSLVTYQNRRYWDLNDLALLRNDYDLAEYFREKSGMTFVDWCD